MLEEGKKDIREGFHIRPRFALGIGKIKRYGRETKLDEGTERKIVRAKETCDMLVEK